MSRILAFALIPVLITSPVFALTPNPDAQAAFDQAAQMRASGNLDAAEQLLKQAVELQPDNPMYHFEMANLYADMHDRFKSGRDKDRADAALQRVTQELEETLMLDPGYVPARFNLAVTFKRLGEFERSREIFRDVIAQAEKTGDSQLKLQALMQIAEIYQIQGFFDEARDTYKEAREIDYYNTGIRDALEDLEINERNAKQRSDQQGTMRALENLRQGYQNSPLANSGFGQMAQAQNQSTAGQQALPYLGMMLAQQFLNRGSRSAQNEDY
ncbi:MAG TPA: tetratricopeptide repeat protein [Verrucomicrobiae bacterium]|nr:tetratricopeptide repeat protein [Verrucomicrobiae bacterium]